MAVVAAALSEITLSLSCTLVLSESKLAIMLVLEINRKKKPDRLVEGEGVFVSGVFVSGELVSCVGGGVLGVTS